MFTLATLLRSSVAVVALAIGLIAAPMQSDTNRPAAVCQPAGPAVPLADLAEASGVAVSRRSQGRLWSINDSGAPILVALDAHGKTTARVPIAGARVEDWEAMAIGACPSGSCLFIADIGDNTARRSRITIYRLQEPDNAATSTSPVETFHATYPDGPHDAETILVGPSRRLFIVTKGETGPVALYAFPAELQANAANRLEKIGAGRAEGRVQAGERITDGAVSPDGRWVALRTLTTLHLHRAADLFAGNWKTSHRVDLTPIREPQGEGVSFVNETTLVLAGEGESRSEPGTLAYLKCTLD